MPWGGPLRVARHRAFTCTPLTGGRAHRVAPFARLVGVHPSADSPGAPGQTRDRYAWTALVAANLVPLALVLAGLWDISGVMLLYWAENLVIGFYNLWRIALAGRGSAGEKVALSAFFTVHYGMFCLAHGMLIAQLFNVGANAPPPPFGADRWEEFVPLAHAFSGEMWLAIVALLASHGVSFVRHYLIGGERREAEPERLMMRPYGRIVVMHVVVLGGAMIVQELGAPLGALMLLIALKTWLDLTSHHRSHARAAKR